MTRYVGKRGKALAMAGRGVARVAICVAIQVEEESELHVRASAAAPAMPRAVACVSARRIHVYGIVAVGDRARDHLAHFAEDSARGRLTGRSRAGVRQMRLRRESTGDKCAVRLGVFGVRTQVGCPPDVGVEVVQAAELVADEV